MQLLHPRSAVIPPKYAIFSFEMRFLRLVILIWLVIDTASSIVIACGNILEIRKSIPADCPQIDDSDMVITASDCNKADGSITGITGRGGTGTYVYRWYDANQKLLGNNSDLLNVSAGVYTLEMTDQSKCPPVSRSYTVAQNNNIIIDQSQLKITPTGCAGNDGSVTGLKVQNAAQYQWFNAANKLVGTSPDLANMVSGAYNFVATNVAGCSTSIVFRIPNNVVFPTITQIDTTEGICGVNAGYITLMFNPGPNDPIYRFAVNQGEATVLTGIIAYTDGTPVKVVVPVQVPNTDYVLVVTDRNYCTNTYGPYTLPAPVFTVVQSPFFLIRNDACGRHTGAIIGLSFTGGTPNPPPAIQLHQHYTWTDSLGNVVGYTRELTGLGKGTYTVVVVDDGGCRDSKTFRVLDSVGEASPPGINGATLCLPGSTTLSVINPDTKYKYRLYDSTQSTVITENNYGIFQQNVTKTTKYYVTTVNGLCESLQTPVTITVIAPGVIIPNTFTPNNDGINDYWDIPHISDFPGAEVSIYNREGQLVYHSINYDHPFDGKYKGSNLPPGVYYYTIDLKKPDCFGKIAGSLTLVR